MGTNNVFIKFLGNNYYEACVSNNVTITVVEPVSTSITLELNLTELTSSGKILITPKVVDADNNEVTVGSVTIYSDYYLSTSIGTVDLGNSFEYSTTNHNPYSFYAKYAGGSGENVIYDGSQTSSGVKYYHVYSNSLTLTANGETEVTIYKGQDVSILADVKGSGVIYLSIDGENNGTLTKGTATSFTLNEVNDYEFVANYTMANDYYASCVSEKITVHVLDIVQPEISIELSNSTVSKGGTITVTPTVIGASEGKGIVYFYDENNNTVGQIDLNTNTTFDYTVTGEAGSFHSIWAKYVDSVSTYPEANSTKKDYKIKGILTITLARDGEGVVIAGDTVDFTITYSDAVSDNLELWVNETNLGDEDCSDSTSITFDESDVGANNVFIKFLGNDDYDACVSNNVTVEVVKPLSTTVTLELDPNAVLSGQNITVIPAVKDENGNDVTVGVVKIYDTSSYYYADPVLTINVGETGNYSDSTHHATQNAYLYAVYFPADGTYKQSEVSAGVAYTILASNTLELTVNGASEITVEEGASFNVLANFDWRRWSNHFIC